MSLLLGVAGEAQAVTNAVPVTVGRRLLGHILDPVEVARDSRENARLAQRAAIHVLQISDADKHLLAVALRHQRRSEVTCRAVDVEI